MSNCLYINNHASSHFFVTGNSTVNISHSQFLYNNITKTYNGDKKGLITTDHTEVNFRNCAFVRNMIGNTKTKLILISWGKLNVEDCVFYFNFPNREIIANEMATVAIDSSQNVNFTNTVFNVTLFPSSMAIISKESNLRNFLLINNCSFRFSMRASIYILNITDIFFYNSFLELMALLTP